MTVSFARTEEEPLKAISEGKVSLINITDQNLTLINKNKQSILWNKPTTVGASILKLSKLFMLEFHYKVMKKQTDCVLLYSDSFIYKLKSKNFYDDLEKKLDLKNHFDLSNFPTDHKLYDRSYERVVSKFKDEVAGTTIQEFCAHKPKLYSNKQKWPQKGPKNLLVPNWTMRCLKRH